MNAFDSIVAKKPREKAGALAANRFAYQLDWGLSRLLELEESGLRLFFDEMNAICVEDLGFDASLFPVTGFTHKVDKALKNRVLGDILDPEFGEETPKRLLPRVWFRFRRWQANGWKQRLCYNESRWSAFWSGVWNHLLKPSSI